MIPQFNISGQSVNPEQIVDIIPEQEKSDAQIQANEEKYFRQLQQVGEDKLKTIGSLETFLNNKSEKK